MREWERFESVGAGSRVLTMANGLGIGGRGVVPTWALCE
jgi:hypothetical protein